MTALRSALARFALASERVQVEAAESGEAGNASEASEAETSDAEPEGTPEEAEADDSTTGEPSANDGAGPSGEGPSFSTVHRSWRAAYYRPYWYYPRYRHGYSHWDDEYEDDETQDGWVFPRVPAEQDDGEPASAGSDSRSCPRRWLLRQQGRPTSDGPGPGLVCLTDVSSSPGEERLTLLRGLLRIMKRSSPPGRRLALLVHGARLGVVIPPRVEAEPPALAANLTLLGLGEAEARAAALLRAFATDPAPPGASRRPIAIDDELHLVIMQQRKLAEVLAAQRDGRSLRRTLGVVLAEVTSEPPSPPELRARRALGQDRDGCPQPDEGAYDVATVNSALCVGDGALIGGREGNSATTFHEIEPAREAS